MTVYKTVDVKEGRHLFKDYSPVSRSILVFENIYHLLH